MGLFFKVVISGWTLSGDHRLCCCLRLQRVPDLSLLWGSQSASKISLGPIVLQKASQSASKILLGPIVLQKSSTVSHSGPDWDCAWDEPGPAEDGQVRKLYGKKPFDNNWQRAPDLAQHEYHHLMNLIDSLISNENKLMETCPGTKWIWRRTHFSVESLRLETRIIIIIIVVFMINMIMIIMIIIIIIVIICKTNRWSRSCVASFLTVTLLRGSVTRWLIMVIWYKEEVEDDNC